MQRPHLLAIVWIAYAVIVQALPPAPSPLDDTSLANPPSIDTNASTLSSPEVYCFKPSDPRAFPTTANYCPGAIDNIVQRDGIPSFYATQTFYSGPGSGPEETHKCPDQWIINDYEGGVCQVIVARAGRMVMMDVFRLLDVAAKAQEIYSKCIEGEKDSYGGTVDVGHDMGFFVAVTGRTEGVRTVDDGAVVGDGRPAGEGVAAS